MSNKYPVRSFNPDIDDLGKRLAQEMFEINGGKYSDSYETLVDDIKSAGNDMFHLREFGWAVRSAWSKKFNK